MRSSIDIEKKVNRYQLIAIIIAILVHTFAIITGIIVLVLGSFSVYYFLIIHGSIQILAFIHVYLGPKFYEKRLRSKN